MMSNEKQILIDFVKLYKELPCLWDQSHSLYTNKDTRNHAYNLLIETFKLYQKDATMEIMKKKLENMRTTCKREYKKVLAARVKGLEHRPTLWYYDLFSFILNDDDDNQLDTTEGDNNEESQQFEYKYDEEYEEDESEAKRIKISEFFVPNPSNIDDTTPNPTNDDTANDMNDEEALAFGRTIGLQIKELDNDQKFIAQKLISDAIFYGRINKLSANSMINLD